jgi:iron complex transport system ATP-binding protein
LVLVTHHVEEIPPGFTHALVLKDGKVAASGSLRATVTSEILGDAFGIDLRVEESQGRYTARLGSTDGAGPAGSIARLT